MELSPKYDLVPYGQSDRDVLPYSLKSKLTNNRLAGTPINRHDFSLRPTLYTHSNKPEIIQKTYDSKRGIQHSKINQIGSQVNIYV
jgi:hypothetical protein